MKNVIDHIGDMSCACCEDATQKDGQLDCDRCFLMEHLGRRCDSVGGVWTAAMWELCLTHTPGPATDAMIAALEGTCRGLNLALPPDPRTTAN